MIRLSGILWLCLLLSACSPKTESYLVDLNARNINIDEKHDKQESIEQLIAPYRNQLESEMSEVIAFLEDDLKKSRPSSPLGNWFADILKKETEHLTQDKVDFALQNYGGLRIPAVAKGDITVGKIYELMPFDNIMLVLDCSGNVVQQLCNRIAEKGGWPVSEGLEFTIAGDRAEDIQIHGMPLDLNASYKVAIPDYIANGGDNCDFLIPLKRIDTGVYVRDAVINNLRRAHVDKVTYRANFDQRISTKN